MIRGEEYFGWLAGLVKSMQSLACKSILVVLPLLTCCRDRASTLAAVTANTIALAFQTFAIPVFEMAGRFQETQCYLPLRACYHVLVNPYQSCGTYSLLWLAGLHGFCFLQCLRSESRTTRQCCQYGAPPYPSSVT
jgi:hypothetical protein